MIKVVWSNFRLSALRCSTLIKVHSTISYCKAKHGCFCSNIHTLCNTSVQVTSVKKFFFFLKHLKKKLLFYTYFFHIERGKPFVVLLLLFEERLNILQCRHKVLLPLYKLNVTFSEIYGANYVKDRKNYLNI